MRWQLIERLRSLPLRINLMLLNTVAVLGALLLVLLAVRTAVRIALYTEAEQVLLGEVRATTMALNELYPDTDAVVAELRRKAASHVDRGWFVHLVKGDRTTLWKSPTCPDAVATKPVDESRIEAVMSFDEYLWARRRITDLSMTPFYVRIGLPREVIESRAESVTASLVPIGVVVALCTPLAGYWLALRATRPISHILEVADGLSPTMMGDRLAVRGTGDELDRLSSKINRLLDSVADHVERQQQFVADAAHEIRGPLTAIQSTLEVATTKDRSITDYRGTIEDVLAESRHLSRLANDLLLLTEVGSPDRSLVLQRLSMAAIVHDAVEMFTFVAEDRGVELTMSLDGPCLVEGEPRHLRQLIANLLDNAIRFTPPGGRITIGAEPSAEGAFCVMTVRDNGIGIGADHLPYVFDRFYQVDPARDRGDARRGGGLGLAICRSIVLRHGGSITLGSRLGEGTAVTVTLPGVTATRGDPRADAGLRRSLEQV